MDEWLRIAMDPIPDSKGSPGVFTVGCNGAYSEKWWLRGGSGRPDYGFPAFDSAGNPVRFIFLQPSLEPAYGMATQGAPNTSSMPEDASQLSSAKLLVKAIKSRWQTLDTQDLNRRLQGDECTEVERAAVQELLAERGVDTLQAQQMSAATGSTPGRSVGTHKSVFKKLKGLFDKRCARCGRILTIFNRASFSKDCIHCVRSSNKKQVGSTASVPSQRSVVTLRYSNLIGKTVVAAAHSLQEPYRSASERDRSFFCVSQASYSDQAYDGFWLVDGTKGTTGSFIVEKVLHETPAWVIEKYPRVAHLAR